MCRTSRIQQTNANRRRLLNREKSSFINFQIMHRQCQINTEMGRWAEKMKSRRRAPIPRTFKLIKQFGPRWAKKNGGDYSVCLLSSRVNAFLMRINYGSRFPQFAFQHALLDWLVCPTHHGANLNLHSFFINFSYFAMNTRIWTDLLRVICL